MSWGSRRPWHWPGQARDVRSRLNRRLWRSDGAVGLVDRRGMRVNGQPLRLVERRYARQCIRAHGYGRVSDDDERQR